MKERAETAAILITENSLLSKVELSILADAIAKKKDIAISIIPESEGKIADIVITIVDLKGKGLELCPLWLHPEKDSLIKKEEM